MSGLVERDGTMHLRPVVEAETRCVLVGEDTIRELMCRVEDATEQLLGGALHGACSFVHRRLVRHVAPDALHARTRPFDPLPILLTAR